MTRDQAIQKVDDVKAPHGYNKAQWLVDALIALDLLRVDTPQSAEQQAVAVLQQISVPCNVDGVTQWPFKLTPQAAGYIVDTLVRVGFQITRTPK